MLLLFSATFATEWTATLQLTDEMRRRFPSVPVILMTAHGSELIALDALMRGATDFVPKAKLAGELCRAVEAVLSVNVENSREQRLQNCLRFEQTHYELENDTMLIPPLVDHLQCVARELNLVDDADRMRLAKALVEAISNAMLHGNLELPPEDACASRHSAGAAESIRGRGRQAPYSDRRVTVQATVSPGEGRFVVRDEGPGFDTRKVPNVMDDPSHLANIERRGLVLIKLFMDEIHFNDQGNEITLVKYRRAGVPQAANSPASVEVS